MKSRHIFALVILTLGAHQTVCSADGLGIPVPIPTNAVPFTIQAPCLSPDQLRATNQVDLQACVDTDVGGVTVPAGGVLHSTKRLITNSETRDSSGTASGVLDTINDVINKRIECFYDGTIMNLTPTASSSDACGGGVHLSAPGFTWLVCSQTDNEGTSANPNNHKNQFCGIFGRTGTGVWETAQQNGLHVQALKHFRKNAFDEIEAKYTLTIRSKSCESMANTYLALMEDAKNISDNIIKASPTLAKEPTLFKRAISFCEADDAQMQAQLARYQQTTSVEMVKSAIPRAAACSLAASREHRIALFSAIVQCEIDGGISRFEKKLPAYVQEYNQKVAACKKGAEDKGNDVGHDKMSESAGEKAGREYFDHCYNPWVPDFFNRIVNDALNTTTRLEACPKAADPRNPLNLNLLFCPFLFGSLRRKQRAKKIAKTSALVILNVPLLIASAYLSMSCGGGSGGISGITMLSTCFSTQPSMTDSSSVRTLLQKCCAKGNTGEYTELNPALNLNDPQGADCRACPLLSECNGTTTNPQVSGANSAQNAAQTQNQARDLVSNLPSGGGLGGDIPSTAAATAGDNGTRLTKAPGADSGRPPEMGKNGTQSGSSGPTAGGAAGGNPFKTDSTSNGPAYGQGGPNLGNPTTDSTAGQYTNAGSGAAKAGGGNTLGQSGSGGLFGWGSGSGSNSGADVNGGAINFKKAGQDGNAMGSEDPEDYFTRLNPEDNLFKVVSRRYQHKTMNWAVPDSPSLQQTIKP